VNEHSFIRAIHKSLPAEVYRWKIHDTFTGGVPDTLYAGPSGILFIEYKWLKSLPKRESTFINLGLSQLQINWLDKFHSYNQNVAVAVGYSEGVLLFTNKDWTKDINVANIRKYRLSRKDYISFIMKATQ
tara:strand:- start:1606 stop:1995 length:390 start_codon:yes stop_codon:yes gene_type:complete